MSYRCILLLFCLQTAPSGAVARTWHILNDGSGDAPTIQAGVDSAAAGDTVLVGPGTYLENLSIIAKDLVLKSEHGPATTILDGSNKESAVIHLSGQTRAMVLEGFTITGGVGRQVSTIFVGGGIALEGGASPVIRDNHVVGNGVLGKTRFGGGIGNLSSPNSPRIERNYFATNYADLGGGMDVVIGTIEIVGNEFRNNDALLDGGAIYAVFNSGSVSIKNNQFWNNSAGDHGGGIHVGGTSASVVHIEWNLFVGNRADGSGSRDNVSGGAVRIARVTGTLINNTFAFNVGPTWTDCAGGGLSLEEVPQDLEISGNIFAFNTSCGLTCEYGTQNSLGPNLFWMNEDGNLRLGPGACPSGWETNQVFADPLFCGPEIGNYSVSIESPALTGPILMGVWTSPGCGPGVATRPTTWGRIKALYR